MANNKSRGSPLGILLPRLQASAPSWVQVFVKVSARSLAWRGVQGRRSSPRRQALEQPSVCVRARREMRCAWAPPLCHGHPTPHLLSCAQPLNVGGHLAVFVKLEGTIADLRARVHAATGERRRQRSASARAPTRRFTPLPRDARPPPPRFPFPRAGSPSDRVSLLFNGRRLHDDTKTVASFGVKKESTIHEVHIARGGAPEVSSPALSALFPPRSLCAVVAEERTPGSGGARGAEAPLLCRVFLQEAAGGRARERGGSGSGSGAGGSSSSGGAAHALRGPQGPPDQQAVPPPPPPPPPPPQPAVGAPPHVGGVHRAPSAAFRRPRFERDDPAGQAAPAQLGGRGTPAQRQVGPARGGAPPPSAGQGIHAQFRSVRPGRGSGGSGGGGDGSGNGPAALQAQQQQAQQPHVQQQHVQRAEAHLHAPSPHGADPPAPPPSQVRGRAFPQRLSSGVSTNARAPFACWRFASAPPRIHVCTSGQRWPACATRGEPVSRAARAVPCHRRASRGFGVG